MESTKPRTLLEQIKEYWKVITCIDYTTFLTVFWKDGKNRWHVKPYKMDEHTTVYKDRDWIEGFSFHREDWDELQQVADKCKAAYCSLWRDPHMISPRKEEQYVRRMAYSPEGFRQSIRVYSPDEWDKYQQFHPPEYLK